MKNIFQIVLTILCYILSSTLFCQQINLKDTLEINKPISSPSPWLTTRQELLNLLPKNAIVAEIGVEAGVFSKSILSITEPHHLFLIDCWTEQPTDIFPENRPEQLQLSLYQKVQQEFAGNDHVTIIKEFSSKAATLFPDDYFDWIYIDANHSYEAVKEDLEIWFAKVKDGGFITGHDYFIFDRYDPKHESLLTNILDDNYYGVVQAVNEFIIKYNLSIIYLTTELDISTEKAPSYAIKIKKIEYTDPCKLDSSNVEKEN